MKEMNGTWLRRFAESAFDRATLERVIFPALADLQHEAGTPSGRRHALTVLRAYSAVWKTLLICMVTRQFRDPNPHQLPTELRSSVLMSIVSDLRYTIRSLKRQPGFAVTVAVTLALGLGVNATVFGMVDALVLRPFQFRDYQRLVVVWETQRQTGERTPVTPATFLDWQRLSSSLPQLTAWQGWAPTASWPSEAERLQGVRVSQGFFEVLGRLPSVGRSFAERDHDPGNNRSVIIGDGLWKRRFGGNPEIVGTEISLDGEAYTVVGVALPGFDFPTGAEIWMPLTFGPREHFDRKTRTLTVLGKLNGEQQLTDAQTEFDLISHRIEQEHPETNRDRGASVRTLSTAFRDDGVLGFFGVLQASAGLVLLVACANLAGLLLARASERQREVAVRSALGASRGRIVRQLITETIVLGVIASALALMIAQVALDFMRTSVPPEIARHVEGWNNLRLDGRLLMLIPMLAIGVGFVVGLVPALGATRESLTRTLNDEGAGTAGVKRHRMRQFLVVTEIALALGLLVAAGLSIQGGLQLVRQPGGFEPRGLLTFDLSLPENRYRNEHVRREFADNFLAKVSATGNIDAVALANVVPAAGWSPSVTVDIEDHPISDPAGRPVAGFRSVSAGFFAAMKMPVQRGRAFSIFDREDTQPVAIVSASMADRYWPGVDPIGRRLRLDESRDWLTIVGVVGDVRMYNWWDGTDATAVYRPLRQHPPSDVLSGIVRTTADPAGATTAIRHALRSIDPLLPVDNSRTMTRAITDMTFGLSLLASLMAVCGGIALSLAALGIYSMMTYVVSRRTREFGLRMALGASANDVLRLTLKQAATLTAAGVGIGLVLALLVGYLMASALYGVVVMDLWTVAAVAATLASISLGAAYLPAQRAVRLDPAATLRDR
jgi:putative ABC transport system permease protein